MIEDVGNRCVGCGACLSICPQKAISMFEDRMGFLYPKVDGRLCVNCGLCKKICPVLLKVTINKRSIGYGVQCSDDDILVNSSSGGAFYLLATEMLNLGGVVYGAVFNSDFTRVHHRAAYNIADVAEMCGSKYLQSDVDGTFKKVRENLKLGQWVLYTGTPCQLAALDNYLGNINRDKLVTVDILCHGVCSPKMWEKYLEYRKEEDCGVPENVSMRDKTYGWRKFSLKIQYEGKDYIQPVDKDLYLRGFLRHVYLRKCCYECEFKGLNRCTDITLGDYWDGKLTMPEIDDRGTSLFITHSEKGEQFLQAISLRCVCVKINDIKTVHNDGMYNVPWYNGDRKNIEKKIDAYKFGDLYRKYFSDSLKCKLKRYMYRAIASHKREK